MTEIQYYWTKVGEKHVGQPATADHPHWTRKYILEQIKTIIWYDIPKDGSAVSLPMMPGENIKGVIKELRIPRVSRVGHGNGLAPYGLLAIVGNYKNGRATIYVLDAGDVCTPLLTVFEQKEVKDDQDKDNL